MHHADTQLHCLIGAVDGDLLPVKLNAAAVSAGVVDHRHAKQDIHQGRLTGAIFAHQCVNFSGSDLQLDTFEHFIAKVLFADVLHIQYIFLIHS